MLAGFVQGTDPSWGDYIDNTHVGLLVFDLLGGTVGLENPIEEEVAEDSLPQVVSMHQNYPNPFNPITNIKFDLPLTNQVQLRVVDAAGRLVKVLVNETFSDGTHSVMWDGTDSAGQRCASGTYFYQIVSGFDVATGKMTLVK